MSIISGTILITGKQIIETLSKVMEIIFFILEKMLLLAPGGIPHYSGTDL